MSNLPEKIRSATEELRQLQQDIQPSAAAPQLALNAVQEIADAAFERHSGSGTEVDKAS